MYNYMTNVRGDVQLLAFNIHCAPAHCLPRVLLDMYVFYIFIDVL